MGQNDVLALQSNFQTWKKNRFPSEPESADIYQYYCVEQFTRAFDLGDSQLKSGIVDKGGDRPFRPIEEED